MLNLSLFNRVPACLLLIVLLVASHVTQAQTDPRIDVLGTCIPADPSTGNASTKFFAHYEPTPDSVLWDFGLPEDPDNQDSLKSKHLHPIFTYQEAGQYEVTLSMWIDGDSTGVTHTVDIQQTEDQLQIMDMELEQPVSGEVVLCGEKTLESQLGEGEEGQAVPVVWYRPQSSGFPPTESTEITISSENIDAEGNYTDAGTYYVVYNQGNCPIYQSFRVVIYNESTDNSSRWYFGDGAGINFQTGEGILNRSMQGTDRAIEGNAMIGDENADVLFYSNGESVWYGNSHQIPDPNPISGGTDIGGSREVAQNSIFVEYPQDETLFYLFTINQARELSFTTLDLKAAPETPEDPLKPGVARSETAPTLDEHIKNVPIHTPVAEKITTASRDAGGTWVVVHALGSNNFLSFPVDGEGVGQPVISGAGSVYGTEDTDVTGYMRISGDGSILATAVNQGTNKFIELFRFDTDSGTVSDPVQIPIDEPNGVLYGLELTDSLIYATIQNPNGQSYLYQFAYDSTLNASAIQESEQSFPTDAELGAVQLGPDGQIYIARNGEGVVYQLPNIPYTSSFQLSAELALWDGTTSTLGLPNFGAMAGTSPPESGLSVTPPFCFGDDIEVSGTQRYSNDESFIFEYYKDSPNGQPFFTDPVSIQEGSTSTLPFNRYESLGPGTYFVRLTIINPCGTYPDPNNPEHEEMVEEFTITAKPEAQLKTENVLELCEDQTVTFIGAAIIDGEEVSATEASYFWLDELDNDLLFATGPELTVGEAGSWKFFVVSPSGCPSDTLFVRADELRPDAELGDDIVVCQEEPLPVQDLSIAITNPDDFEYAWFRNGQDLNNNSTRQPISDIDTDMPGSYQYVVEVNYKDESKECFKADTMLITVAARPRVQIIASENNCNGSAVLTADVRGAMGEPEFAWSGPGISSGQGSASININQSGEYRVTMTDDVSGCTAEAIYTIDLDNPLADLELNYERDCGETSYTLSLQSSYSGSDLDIRWFRGSTELEEYRGVREGIAGEPGESYTAQVSITSGECASEDSKTVDLPAVGNEDVSLQSTYTICPTFADMNSVRLSVPGFNRYQWSKIESSGQMATVSLDSIAVIRSEGEYQLVVNDCEPVRFRVMADCTPELFLPNAIRVSANNAQNSIFKILNENMLANIQQFQILILNRWGEVIFQSTDPRFEWRGTDRRGDLVMANTYVYVITYRNSFGDDTQSTKRQRGGIVVLR